MNKNGFTLIELVGSIVIIAIIALLAFPALTSMLNKGQEKVDESVIKVIGSAAIKCVNDNLNDNTLCNVGQAIPVTKLKDNGYISTTFYKQYENDIQNGTVTVTKSGTKYSYSYRAN